MYFVLLALPSKLITLEMWPDVYFENSGSFFSAALWLPLTNLPTYENSSSSISPIIECKRATFRLYCPAVISMLCIYPDYVLSLHWFRIFHVRIAEHLRIIFSEENLYCDSQAAVYLMCATVHIKSVTLFPDKPKTKIEVVEITLLLPLCGPTSSTAARCLIRFMLKPY